MGNACCAQKDKSSKMENRTMSKDMKAGSFVPSMANFKNLRKINEIDDFYNIGKHINTGSFGSVSHAIRIETSSKCALKVVSKSSLL